MRSKSPQCLVSLAAMNVTESGALERRPTAEPVGTAVQASSMSHSASPVEQTHRKIRSRLRATPAPSSLTGRQAGPGPLMRLPVELAERLIDGTEGLA
jgi:hypothetical protein